MGVSFSSNISSFTEHQALLTSLCTHKKDPLRPPPSQYEHTLDTPTPLFVRLDWAVNNTSFCGVENSEQISFSAFPQI